MEQLTLDQAANKFAPAIDGSGVMEGFNKLINEAKQFGFKAGAEWQKEQYKELLALSFFAIEKLKEHKLDGIASMIESQYNKLKD